MNSIYLPNDFQYRLMTLNYCYEIPCRCSLFHSSNENFNLKEKHVPGVKLAESCSVCGK